MSATITIFNYTKRYFLFIYVFIMMYFFNFVKLPGFLEIFRASWGGELVGGSKCDVVGGGGCSAPPPPPPTPTPKND